MTVPRGRKAQRESFIDIVCQLDSHSQSFPSRDVAKRGARILSVNCIFKSGRGNGAWMVFTFRDAVDGAYGAFGWKEVDGRSEWARVRLGSLEGDFMWLSTCLFFPGNWTWTLFIWPVHRGMPVTGHISLPDRKTPPDLWDFIYFEIRATG